VRTFCFGDEARTVGSGGADVTDPPAGTGEGKSEEREEAERMGGVGGMREGEYARGGTVHRHRTIPSRLQA